MKTPSNTPRRKSPVPPIERKPIQVRLREGVAMLREADFGEIWPYALGNMMLGARHCMVLASQVAERYTRLVESVEEQCSRLSVPLSAVDRLTVSVDKARNLLKYGLPFTGLLAFAAGAQIWTTAYESGRALAAAEYAHLSAWAASPEGARARALITTGELDRIDALRARGLITVAEALADRGDAQAAVKLSRATPLSQLADCTGPGFKSGKDSRSGQAYCEGAWYTSPPAPASVPAAPKKR
jgi:hypothetical protein